MRFKAALKAAISTIGLERLMALYLACAIISVSMMLHKVQTMKARVSAPDAICVMVSARAGAEA